MADLGKRYSRNLSGFNAQGYVAGDATMIAAAKTIQDIVLEATVEGAIGILADGVSNVDALVAGEKFQIVQKQDGEIRSSIELIYGADIVVTKSVYDAPVLQVDSFVATNAEITALLAVAGLKEFVASARDTTPGNQPFPVQEGRVVIRNTTTSNYDMFKQLAIELNGDNDYERNIDENFATATVSNAGVAGAVSIATGAVLSKGSNIAVFNAAPTGPTAGEYISFVPAGSTIADLYKIVSIVGAIVTLDRVWGHASQTVLIANMLEGATVTGDWIFSFIGVDTGIHFTSLATEDLSDFAMATVQAWKQGSGDYDSIAAMEKEFAVFQGVTTGNIAFKEDYGQAAAFADPAKTYDLFVIKYKKGTPSMAYANESASHVGYEMIAAEAGSDLSTKLATTFGV